MYRTMILAFHVALLALTAHIAPAAAQPGVTMPTAARPAARPSPRAKLPGRAIVLSASVTLLSGVMVASVSPASVPGVVGLFIGPSVGHWYAGSSNLGGIALRTAAFGIVVVGLSEFYSDSVHDGVSAAELRRNYRRGGAIMFGGLGLFAGSALYDIVTAGNAARRWNREHVLTVAPLVAPSSTGLVVTGHF
jgi:hypothetical protein